MSAIGNIERQINEEYKLWKKNTPFLYDLIMTYALEWPSLTVQWMPDVGRVDEQNYLMLAHVEIPECNVLIDSSMEDPNKNQYGGYGKATGKCEIDIRMCHDGEVNRARFMPQNICVIATKSPSSEVYLFDYTRHPSKPDVKKGSQPDLILCGHTKEGYGLSWNPLVEGKLLSSSDDGSICYWDINSSPASSKRIEATSIYKRSSIPVGDVSWHNFHKNMFVCGCDNGICAIYDDRTPQKTATNEFKAHTGEIYSVAMSPFSPNIFATGSSDKMIKLWDIRNVKDTALYSLEAHRADVTQIEWSPHKETMLASCSADRRVNIWDLSMIGVDPTREDIEDGPPELLFVHGGHTAKVCDISWNINEPLMISSVAEDNIIQFWKMIYGVDSDDESPNLKRDKPEEQHEAPFDDTEKKAKL